MLPWLFASSVVAAPVPEVLLVPVGRSLVVTLPEAPLAVSVTDPSVVTVVPLGSATVLQVQGLRLGGTDLVISLPRGEVSLLEVEVSRDVSELVRVVERLVRSAPAR